MRSPRPYRKAWPVDMTMSFVKERAGFDFDADLTASLVQMLAQRGV
jgi:HD-GYP domain-containing protein (c-di-GMP phosphodiesterase class II)